MANAVAGEEVGDPGNCSGEAPGLVEEQPAEGEAEKTPLVDGDMDGDQQLKQKKNGKFNKTMR
jgi:hypothetical protein